MSTNISLETYLSRTFITTTCFSWKVLVSVIEEFYNHAWNPQRENTVFDAYENISFPDSHDNSPCFNNAELKWTMKHDLLRSRASDAQETHDWHFHCYLYMLTVIRVSTSELSWSPADGWAARWALSTTYGESFTTTAPVQYRSILKRC